MVTNPYVIILLWILGGLVLFLVTLVVVGWFYDKISPGERMWTDHTHEAWYLGNGWVEDKHGTVFTDLYAYERARDDDHTSHTGE